MDIAVLKTEKIKGLRMIKKVFVYLLIVFFAAACGTVGNNGTKGRVLPSNVGGNSGGGSGGESGGENPGGGQNKLFLAAIDTSTPDKPSVFVQNMNGEVVYKCSDFGEKQLPISMVLLPGANKAAVIFKDESEDTTTYPLYLVSLDTCEKKLIKAALLGGERKDLSIDVKRKGITFLQEEWNNKHRWKGYYLPFDEDFNFGDDKVLSPKTSTERLEVQHLRSRDEGSGFIYSRYERYNCGCDGAVLMKNAKDPDARTDEMLVSHDMCESEFSKEILSAYNPDTNAVYYAYTHIKYDFSGGDYQETGYDAVVAVFNDDGERKEIFRKKDSRISEFVFTPKGDKVAMKLKGINEELGKLFICDVKSDSIDNCNEVPVDMDHIPSYLSPSFALKE